MNKKFVQTLKNYAPEWRESTSGLDEMLIDWIKELETIPEPNELDLVDRQKLRDAKQCLERVLDSIEVIDMMLKQEVK